jgi:hypothetical protein
VHVFQPCKKKNQSKLNIKGMLPLYYNASRKDYGVLFPLVFPRVFFYFVAALILVSRSGYFVFFGWRAFSCCCRFHTTLGAVATN